MKIILTDIEKAYLKKLHRELRDQRNCDRIKAIILLSDNYTINKVADILLIDRDTISRWAKKFNNKSTLSDWLVDNYRIYSGRLNPEQKKKIINYVDENTINNSKQIIEYIKIEFNISYKESGVVALLHTLGFSYKNTVLVPSKYDEEKQKNFKDIYENLEKHLSKEEVILFTDGVHPQHNTKCSKAWIRVGETKEVKSNSGRSRINIQGAYNPHNQEIIIHEDKNLNAENTIEFFKKIEKAYLNKKTIHLILDNAAYYRNKVVTKFLETSRVKTIFLPPYSPNLNLIERLWKFMRKKVINNKYYEKFTLFKKSIFEFFENSINIKDELATFIGCKLHLLKK